MPTNDGLILLPCPECGHAMMILETDGSGNRIRVKGTETCDTCLEEIHVELKLVKVKDHIFCPTNNYEPDLHHIGPYGYLERQREEDGEV
jgi:ssDNA-binding Zn-finger/Zn-ribbon topoisomerase 1